MPWSDNLSPTILDWLLEPETPSARYLALRDVLDYSPNDPDLIATHAAAHQTGHIAAILAAMKGPDYWMKPGPGYSGKYKSTVWSVIALAQLGASIHQDQRIALACDHLLAHAFLANGQFTMSGTPSSNIDCLQGNLCAAMIDLGITDARLTTAFDWMARSVTGDNIAPNTDKTAEMRYYNSTNCGPGFACGYNDRHPCAWGAIKVLLAFSKLPTEQRTPLMQHAIQAGIDLLLGTDPALADYPIPARSTKPSRNWWKLSFPVFYVADILQNVEALVALGYGGDPRLDGALALIRAKQDDQGRWPLEHNYNTWVDFGEKKQPNKWVTIRVLRTLKAIDQSIQSQAES